MKAINGRCLNLVSLAQSIYVQILMLLDMMLVHHRYPIIATDNVATHLQLNILRQIPVNEIA